MIDKRVASDVNLRVSLQEIESAVSNLSSEELAAFRRWFMSFDEQGWRAAADELDAILLTRLAGPFAPLESDWKNRVRKAAAEMREA